VVFRQERWQDVEGGTIEGRTEVTVDVELETAYGKRNRRLALIEAVH
jgi:hypothetical protein